MDDSLNKLLKKIHNSPSENLLPAEVADLVSAFSGPTALSRRPRAYVVLSSLCQGVRKNKKDPSEATKSIVSTFGKAVVELLGDTNEPAILAGVSFLTALFQVDVQSAAAIFAQETVVENLMDTVELSPSDQLAQEVAHLLGQACGEKSCRGIVTPQIVRWLEFKSKQTKDLILQASSVVALIKLSRGSATDGPESGTPNVSIDKPLDVAETMVETTLAKDGQARLDAVEALAYLSVDPEIKELLASNPVFLKHLFAMVPMKKQSFEESKQVLSYGVLVIVHNLSARRPQLTEEQRNIEKLKRMAKANPSSAKQVDEPSPLDDAPYVKTRIGRLVDAGLLPIFPAAISSSDSAGIRDLIGKSILSIVEERENRGKVLQTGGSRVLQTIIKQAIGDSTKSPDLSTVSTSVLEAIQALAKLAITSSPIHVFGPDVGAMYDAIRPFSILLQHTSSSLLQRFEAIMALTNLASYNPDLASRVAQGEGLLNKVELLLLEDHTLVRRASMELICNLIVGSDEVFQRYGGQETATATSKVQILLALADVDDLPTRTASAGALATVTAAPGACQSLLDIQAERNRFFAVMAQLVDPRVTAAETEDGQPLQGDPGLTHRGVVCLINVLQIVKGKDKRKELGQQARESRLIEALKQLVGGKGLMKDPTVLRSATEALEILEG